MPIKFQLLFKDNPRRKSLNASKSESLLPSLLNNKKQRYVKVHSSLRERRLQRQASSTLPMLNQTTYNQSVDMDNSKQNIEEFLQLYETFKKVNLPKIIKHHYTADDEVNPE